MSARRAKAKLLLTERSLRDIAEIEAYSIDLWGKRTANKYIRDIEAGLVRLQEKQELLREQEELHPSLRFYRVNKHVLVCDVRPKSIVLLTVIHAGRDIPSRLAELEPTLAAEVELLHKKLARSKKK